MSRPSSFLFFLLLPFLLLFSFRGTAQDTLVVRYDAQLLPTKDTAAPNAGVLIREGDRWSATVFDVATRQRVMTGYYTADAQTEEGPFDYYTADGIRYLHGYYHQGKRIGMWKQWDDAQRLTDSLIFDDGTIQVDAQYSYLKNGQLGTLRFTNYKEQHRILRSYTEAGMVNTESEWWGRKGLVKNYNDRGLLAQLVEYDSLGVKLKPHYYNRNETEISEAEYLKNIHENEPEFKGGHAALQRYFERNMRVPRNFHLPNSSIKVTLTFMLDEQGKAFNVSVLEYSDLQWQQAAIDFFERMPNWDMKGHRIWGPLAYTFELNF